MLFALDRYFIDIYSLFLLIFQIRPCYFKDIFCLFKNDKMVKILS